jgi:hypothetical protein
MKRRIILLFMVSACAHADTLQVEGFRFMMQFTAPCPLPPPQAFVMLSSPVHLKKITNADRIAVLNRSSSGSVLRYDYSYLFLKTSMDFGRLFDSSRLKIDFIMKAYSQNNNLLPRIDSSVGYYRVFPDSTNGCTIACRQLTTFKRPLNDFERFVLETVTRKQMKAIRRYFAGMHPAQIR